MNTHKSIEEQLAKLMSDCVWEVTDGGQKLEPHRFLSYQEEPVQSFEEIVRFIQSYAQQQVQEAVEREIELYKLALIKAQGEPITEQIIEMQIEALSTLKSKRLEDKK